MRMYFRAMLLWRELPLLRKKSEMRASNETGKGLLSLANMFVYLLDYKYADL